MAKITSKEEESLSSSFSGNDICGLIMPIGDMSHLSGCDGCTQSHWKDVKTILEGAIAKANFTSRLVSESDEVRVIQSSIVQNIYDDKIVVCDVSCKNPNVMFELGMRLAFDKPVVIVKDNSTSYSFDTSIIEHIEYPRDLRYGAIVAFQDRLADKIKSTYTASNDNGYSPFVKNFHNIKVASIETKEVGIPEAVLGQMSYIREELSSLRRDFSFTKNKINQNSFYDDSIPKNYIIEFIRDYIKDNNISIEDVEVNDIVKTLPSFMQKEHSYLRTVSLVKNAIAFLSVAEI